MWPNSLETADLVTFTQEILIENFIFCAMSITISSAVPKQWKILVKKIFECHIGMFKICLQGLRNTWILLVELQLSTKN